MSDDLDLLGFSTEEIKSLETTAAEKTNRGAQADGESRSGRYKSGESRFQSDGLGLCLDDRVSPDSQVRLIDLYVDQLDLAKLGFSHALRKHSAGQPAYNPACLLKLYLYGYMNQVRSGRRLARECTVNLEVMWLLEGQTPQYRTINTFRADNCKALVKTHQDFLMLCNKLMLVGGDRLSIDGSHIKGNVSGKSFSTVKGLKAKQAKAKAEAKRWLVLLEQEDKTPSADVETVDLKQVQAALDALEAEIDQTQDQLDALNKLGKTQLSKTDPDARLLRKSGTSQRGYNVQIVSDHKNYLVIGCEVTLDANDMKQLYPMVNLVRQQYGWSQFEVVADKGYYNARHIGLCGRDITPYVAIPKLARSQQQRDTGYAKSQFVYDAESDTYRCPAGQLMTRVGNNKPRYRNRKACEQCEHRDECLIGKSKYREIWPTGDETWSEETEQLVAEHSERMQTPEAKVIYAQRQGAVEHPFGTMKARAGHNHFHLRGKEKVSGEMSLMVLCYNFTRVANILGFAKLKGVLKELIRQASRFLFALEAYYKRKLASQKNYVQHVR